MCSVDIKLLLYLLFLSSPFLRELKTDIIPGGLIGNELSGFKVSEGSFLMKYALTPRPHETPPCSTTLKLHLACFSFKVKHVTCGRASGLIAPAVNQHLTLSIYIPEAAFSSLFWSSGRRDQDVLLMFLCIFVNS